MDDDVMGDLDDLQLFDSYYVQRPDSAANDQPESVSRATRPLSFEGFHPTSPLIGSAPRDIAGHSLSRDSPERWHGTAPEDPLPPDALDALLLRASPQFNNARFSKEDITRDPKVATAARRELDDTQLVCARSGGGSTDGSFQRMHSGSNGFTGVHEIEIERQRAGRDEIDSHVLEEAKINKEMADVLCERLIAGFRSTKSLVSMLQMLSAAEAAYSAALSAASKVQLVSEADGKAFQAAVLALSQLPSGLSRSHRELHAVLLSTTVGLQALLESYRVACQEVAAQAAAAQKQVDQRRQGLRRAFSEHSTACRTFDVVLAERTQGRPARCPEQDPWATEGRLVENHKSLQQYQVHERDFLHQAFTRVSTLEGQRIALMKAALEEAGGAYRATLAPLQHQLDAMAAAVHVIDPARSLSDLTRAAQTATETATVLTTRQSNCIQGVCQELFCSPEIVRQGLMTQLLQERGPRWSNCHCVLTRAGYLYWFNSMDDTRPVDCLNLSRCQFEAGEAPSFNLLVECQRGWLGSSKHRRCTFQAASVDDCCEWCIAIREAIAVACGRQVSYEDG